MNSILNDLHNQITNACKNNSYLTVSKGQTNEIIISPVKNSKINEVFERAQQQIQDTFKDSQSLSLFDLDYTNIKATLKLLKNDGELLYKRYHQKTKKFFFLIKFLVKITPQFIAKKLFIKYLEKEQKVKIAYQDYDNYLNQFSALKEKKQLIAELLMKMIQQLDQMKTIPLSPFNFKAELIKQILELSNKIDALPQNLGLAIDLWIKDDPNFKIIYPIYQKHTLIKESVANHQELNLNDILTEIQWKIHIEKLDFFLKKSNLLLDEWLYDEKFIGKKAEAILKIKTTCYNQTKTLDLSCLGLNQVPPGLSDLNLVELNLSCNNLQNLSPEIEKLVNLHTLNLSQNKLQALPPEIEKLVNLHTLNLNSNKLQQLPQTIGQLVNLHTLNLSQNKLQALPQTIKRLVNLHTLNLNRNQFLAFPQIINQLVSLHTLSLSYNQLQKLPPEIEKLANLQTLNLSYNQLQTLPQTIKRLVNLHTLNLNSNKLQQLPQTIGQLVNLENLFLAFNQLQELPQTIEQLVNLKNLDVTLNSNLKEVPLNMDKMTHLLTFDIERTKISAKIR